MATYDGGLVNGPPGTRYTNDTSRVLYQFVASLINTCGTCIQYHMQIGTFWPIPLHRGCNCRQELVPPGKQAPHEFVDFEKILADLPQKQQIAAIGKSNYALLSRNIVEWEDVVTPSRVRTFQEVVSRKNLTVDRLTKAGVDRGIAEKAYANVHTPEHEFVEKQRRDLLERLRKAGLSQDVIVSELSRRLAGRVGIAAGLGIAEQGLPGVGGMHASDLAKFLVISKITRVAMKPKPKLIETSAERQEFRSDVLGVAARLPLRSVRQIYLEIIKIPKYARLTLKEFKRLIAEDPEMQAFLTPRR